MKPFLSISGSGTRLVCLSIFLSNCSISTDKTPPRSHSVVIQSMQFQPVELTVQKGDTVVFVNKDILVHDVTEERRKTWSSAPLSTGETYKMVVLESADYYCSIHPVMKGKLLVQ